MKVQLDFNATTRVHSLYDSFFSNPPQDVLYSKSEFVAINEKTYSRLGKIRKSLIGIFPSIAKLDNFILSLLRKESGSDLIHFTFHLGNTNKNCVVDYETCYSFIDGDEKLNKKEKDKSLRLLKKGNVKYLMPIHEEALRSFNLFFGNEIRIPQKIIYPTVFIPDEHRPKVEKKKKVIFVSTSNILDDQAFLIKGGLETLEAFEILAKKHSDYEFVFLGKIPNSFNQKVPKNLKLINGVSREEMWAMFNESQIFVQPSYQAPAMAFIEAMFFKLPIVTTKFWAIPEYVDSKNGVIVDSIDVGNLDENNVPFYSEDILDKIKKNSGKNADKIVAAIEKLIKSPTLRKKLGEDGFERVTAGKFSINEKNKKLLEVYNKALNS